MDVFSVFLQKQRVRGPCYTTINLKRKGLYKNNLETKILNRICF